jgi:diguanylate cyclase (GGDEF)-like protein/PAS domain S-box-containing protein
MSQSVIPGAASSFALSERELLRAVVAESPVAQYVVAADGVVYMWNRAAAELFGWSAAEAVGRRLPIVGPPDDDEFNELRARVIGGQGFSGLETFRQRKDGTRIEVAISTVPLRDAQGAVVAVLGSSVDLTESRRAAAALMHQATHDALTGLPNRTAFLEAVSREMARSWSPAVLVYLNIDNFKDVNDTRGHRVGDELLQRFAERLSRSARPRDVVGCLGGDDFAILLTDVAPDRAAALAQDILLTATAAYSVGGREVSVQASAGLTACGGAHDAMEALGQADVALHQAKRLARGGLAIFDHAMQRALAERVELVEELQSALAGDAIQVHYQPIISLRTRSVVGVEALARWNHPRLGWVLPDRFIPLIEATGDIGSLGTRVLGEACAQLSRWQTQYPDSLASSLAMSVNVSTVELDDPFLVTRVHEALTRNGLAAQRLCLEVTETALTRDLDEARRTLSQLTSLGVGLAIDDFGTGHASLTLVRDMPFEKIKIDGSFVEGIGTDEKNAAIVVATLDLARALGLGTLAEGVQTREQLQFLIDHGCEQAQGFLFGHPAPPEAMGALLTGERIPGLASA